MEIIAFFTRTLWGQQTIGNAAPLDTGAQAQILIYFWMLLVGIYLLLMLARHKQQYTFLPRFLFRGLLYALAYVIGTMALMALFPFDVFVYTSYQIILAILISGVSVKIIFVFPDDGAIIQQVRHWKTLNTVIGVTAGIAALNFVALLLFDFHLHALHIIHDFIPVVFMLWNALLTKSRIQSLDAEKDILQKSKVYTTYQHWMAISATGIIFSSIIAFGSVLVFSETLLLFFRANGLMLMIIGYYFTLTNHDYAKELFVQRLALFIGLMLFFIIALAFFISFSLMLISPIPTQTFVLILLIEVGLSVFFIAGVPPLLTTLFPDLKNPPPAMPSALTPRQREVLALVGQGLSNQDIARALVITEATAKFHVSNLLVEFNCSSRYELAQYAHYFPTIANS